jgi:hypothetical protein
MRIGEILSFLTRFCAVAPAKPALADNVNTSKSKIMNLFGKKSVQEEQPENLNDLLLKLKDEEYVKENLKPEGDDALTAEQEEYIMYLKLPQMENKENQRLMRSFEMESYPIYFIHYRTEEKDAQVKEHISMIKQCYRFLVKYVRGNVQNQFKLRESLDDFLKDIDKHSLAIQLVYEIFKDNKKFLNLNASKILK